MANHARRAGSDSVALAVYVARLRRPTWLAAFPDGGRPLVEDEYGLFYFCVAAPTDPVSLRRLAALPRPPEMATGFTPWVARWEGPAAFAASLRGYAAPEDRPSAFRVHWLRVTLAGDVVPQVAGPPALPPATSLPPACETASVADARQFLDRLPRGS